jgi:hypothetical protein
LEVTAGNLFALAEHVLASFARIEAAREELEAMAIELGLKLPPPPPDPKAKFKVIKGGADDPDPVA